MSQSSIEQMDVAHDTAWLSPEEQSAWLGAAALMIRLPTALDTQLQEDAGLNFFEYMVLAVLSEQENRALQMSDIARAVSSSLSRLSHTVNRLEKQGFVERTRLPGAGRKTMATLTDAGMDKVLASAPGHVRHVRKLLIDAVSPQHLRALGEVGRSVVQQIDPSGEVDAGLWPRTE